MCKVMDIFVLLSGITDKIHISEIDKAQVFWYNKYKDCIKEEIFGYGTY